MLEKMENGMVFDGRLYQKLGADLYHEGAVIRYYIPGAGQRVSVVTQYGNELYVKDGTPLHELERYEPRRLIFTESDYHEGAAQHAQCIGILRARKLALLLDPS